jgi:hypothetical protein
MADIFLSYSRKDAELAGRVAEALKSVGWDVWWDANISAGARFRREIVEQLQTAKCVVVLWSKESVQSDFVIDEAEHGRQRGILVQALLDDVEVPFGFRGIQWANLKKFAGETRHPALADLVAGITRHVPPRITNPEYRPSAVSLASSEPAVPAIAPPEREDPSSQLIQQKKPVQRNAGPAPRPLGGASSSSNATATRKVSPERQAPTSPPAQRKQEPVKIAPEMPGKPVVRQGGDFVSASLSSTPYQKPTSSSDYVTSAWVVLTLVITNVAWEFLLPNVSFQIGFPVIMVIALIVYRLSHGSWW